MKNPRLRPLMLVRFAAVVLFAAGLAACNGDDDDETPPQTGPDTSPPTVSLSAPATASRTVTLTATVSDNVGVTQVEFRVDGTAIATVSAAPFTTSWDTSTVADGPHTLTAIARDAAGNSATSADVQVNVRNQLSFAVTLSGAEENPPTGSAGSATGTIDVNAITGETSGSITVSGFTPTAAHIHDGFAGQNGPIVIGLEQDPGDPAVWNVPQGAVLTAEQLDRLLSGALYVNVHSDAFPGGEVRAQLLPENVRVFFTDLTSREEPALIDAPGSGRAALTVNTDTRAVVAHLTFSGVDDATDAHIHQGFAGANGPVIVGLTRDSADPSHFFVTDASLSQAAYDALLAGGLYFNLHSTTHPDGHLRGQIVPEGVRVIVTDLEGVQEVPAVASNARGRAGVTFVESTRTVHIHLNAQGVDDANAAHLHTGVAGVSGPVTVGLTQDGSAPGHWFVENAVLSETDAAALLSARTYVNLHTPANPSGEIRGQVVPDGHIVLVAPMDGSQEVPEPRTTDASGTVALTVDTASGATEVHINATGVDDAVAAHVHDGFAGVNGPVIIGLTKDSDPARPGHWFITDATLTAEQLETLLAGGLYANVHTPAAPDGLIRGQLLPPNVRLTFTDLTGGEEVPPVSTSATARAATTVDLTSGEVTVHVNMVGLETANAAHVHDAPAGENGPVIIGLTQDPAMPSLWSVVRAAATPEQIQGYLANRWYVNVHTPANPDGEVRGQIIASPEPPPDAQAPTVTLDAVPATISGVVTLSATAADDTGVVVVRFKVNDAIVGTDSTAPYSVDWDSAGVANGQVTIVAEAEDAAGNVGVSAPATATVSNSTGVTPFLFSELQSQVFSMSCALAGCHAGSSPQAGLDLSAGQSYANLVNVPSTEVGTLLRVKAGDAANSYLIRKLEGGPDIVGARMPFGGPPLSQDVINRIRAWIDAGAPNDTAPVGPPPIPPGY